MRRDAHKLDLSSGKNLSLDEMCVGDHSSSMTARGFLPYALPFSFLSSSIAACAGLNEANETSSSAQVAGCIPLRLLGPRTR
jgi:hypothetical protein